LGEASAAAAGFAVGAGGLGVAAGVVGLAVHFVVVALLARVWWKVERCHDHVGGSADLFGGQQFAAQNILTRRELLARAGTEQRAQDRHVQMPVNNTAPAATFKMVQTELLFRFAQAVFSRPASAGDAQETASNDLPVPGGLDTSLGGSLDGFLIKLANDGSSLLYGTYIGGSRFDSVSGVGVDSQGRAYLSGTTNSTDLPTVRTHQPTSGGSLFLNDFPDDGFAASIAADGGSFAYLTYWGGVGADRLHGVAVDAAGNASYVGNANSPDLLTRSAAQPNLLGFPAFVVRLLAGDAGTRVLSNAPFTTVEGNQYNGTVAFFSTNGTETADQFSAIIDWGDGLTSAGTIAGDYHDGFQVVGNHFYDDVGTRNVFVTVRDAFGRTVTARSTGADLPSAAGHVHYRVAIDTTALAGTPGKLSFQFNPGAIPGSPDAVARITGLSLFGGAHGVSTIDGDASPVSSREFSLRPSAALNRLIENITLGTRIEFDLEFVGAGLSDPDFGDFADMFALQLLSTDSSASILRINLATNGSTQAQSAAAAVTIAASCRATVTNAPVSLAIVPITIQEGLEFNGPVATFINGNPLESAAEFTALIDWGDGQTSPGVITVSVGGGFSVIGTHTYANSGTLPVRVDIVDIGGSTATANSTAQVAPHANQQAPLAFSDAYSTNEDATVVVLVAQGVLVNDTDLDGDTLSAVLVALPTHGDLTFLANGSFTYLPAANYFGSDSFAYRAKVGCAESLVSTVTISVKPVNDGPLANDDSAATNEDSPVVKGAPSPALARLAILIGMIHGRRRSITATAQGSNH
jgi:Bacterial Ig domain/Bacterial cadherin-like domain/Beta-propeller repeat